MIRTIGVSSPFQVKQQEAFARFLESCADFQDVQLITDSETPCDSFLFVSEFADGEGGQTNFISGLSEHIAKGWALSLQMHHTFFEGEQVTGVTADAFALNWQGEVHLISLSTIEEIAATMGRTGVGTEDEPESATQ